MNAAVLIRVGQRLISGIHDGAILLDPFEEVIHDVICTLRNLKREGGRLRVAMVHSSRHNETVSLNPGILGTSRADTTGSRTNLSGNQKGHSGPETAPGKGKTARNEVVLMRSKGRVGFMIHIVLDQRNLVCQTEVFNHILQ